MVDEIFDSFGITYFSRAGTKTYFLINNNSAVKDHLEAVMKLLCFYTIAIFQTDSAERKIYYKVDGRIFCEKIDNVVSKMYRTNFFEIYTDSDVEDMGKDHSHECHPPDLDRLKTGGNHADVAGAVKYQITRDRYKGHAKVAYWDDNPDGSKTCELYDFDLGSMPAIILEEDGDFRETVGNYGNFIGGKTFIGSETIDNKYIAFDFDEFGINVEKLSSSKFKCSFARTNSLHHAASMWAQNCLVECTNEYVSQSELVDSVYLELEEAGDYINVKSTYYAINCL